MSSSTSSTTSTPEHLANLTRAELEKRHDDLMTGHNRLLKAIQDDYPEFQRHVHENLPIRPMTKTRSRLLAQSKAVMSELLRVQTEIERRARPNRRMA
ncbi:uncharacterized protein LAJ45_01113 [Morchella importuna]|uniref:uncharacterized protein n=1 Tax=Morchella importuna TaxID=1174673 RepID=UPI001E8CD275|nr:uncharacterized protein LAJ45_01113 [Morchella importuna]KAH8154585.1 hypothetical protein LAJ45_01113 [Morchella importuna]